MPFTGYSPRNADGLMTRFSQATDARETLTEFDPSVKLYFKALPGLAAIGQSGDDIWLHC